jgi:hypothetical protein
MLIETALITYLLAQTAITAKVGNRIDPGEAKQTVAKPYIVVTKISSPGSHTQDGPVGIGNPHYQIASFSLGYGEAHEVAALVKSALNGYQGTMGGAGGVYVFDCFCEDESDDTYPELTPRVYSVIQDYYIGHQES